MAAFQAPHAGCFYPTRRDARYQGAVVIHYPLHPFHELGELTVCRHYGIGQIKHVEVQVDEQRQAVPIWMTDVQSCADMTIGIDPFCSLASLLELRGLLGATGL